ncbi:type II toxin-antitoxin system death-on-curing family toxin [Dongia sedimenti]|uniref:Type II toxin-antitoxin system death-on-curing family toxin n=1 Tax=Dongia sedimenti TaxID=3064282 RepID=A0ABU0YRP1_9PROT|nr:type II toxin-antitoxin system death-on-curing family toxin [Rhodospirillaceae bacterium R-7]
MTWRWIRLGEATAIHAEQIAEHGGLAGVRDQGLFESAMARAENLAAYGEPDACDLAAAYAYGLARNHPFADGNKRTAFVVSATFLILNGRDLTATEVEVVETFLKLAAGALTEPELADWFRARSR